MYNKISKIIEKHQGSIVDEVRDYIGASSIGSECLRQIWYEFKGLKTKGVAPKIRRTWAIGKRLEGLVIDWLQDAGVLMDLDGQTYRSAYVPIFQGHFDAIIFL